MSLCEFYVRNLICEIELEKVVVCECFCFVIEICFKEVIWFKDLEFVEEWVRLIVEIEFLEFRYYLELGEVLIKLGKIEEVVKVYCLVIRLGFLGIFVVWFMVG